MASDDVLTEGEIDALMESVDEGASDGDAADDGQYRRFDFSAREQSLLRQFTALGPLLERQADYLGAALEETFSIEFSVRATPPTLLSVADVLASLEERVAVTNTTLSPLAGPAFAICPASLLSFVVNAYFGGGNGGPAQSSRSELTPSELHLAERIAEVLLASLTQAWAEKLAVQPGEESTTLAEPDRLEMIPRTDLLLRLSFELRTAHLESSVQVLLPFAALEPHRARFAPPKTKTGAEEGHNWEPFFRRELPTIEVELVGVLAARAISIAELTELREGMVIALPPPEQVSLKVGEATLAEGRYGSFEGAKSVQLKHLGSALNTDTA